MRSPALTSPTSTLPMIAWRESDLDDFLFFFSNNTLWSRWRLCVSGSIVQQAVPRPVTVCLALQSIVGYVNILSALYHQTDRKTSDSNIWLSLFSSLASLTPGLKHLCCSHPCGRDYRWQGRRLHFVEKRRTGHVRGLLQERHHIETVCGCMSD